MNLTFVNSISVLLKGFRKRTCWHRGYSTCNITTYTRRTLNHGRHEVPFVFKNGFYIPYTSANKQKRHDLRVLSRLPQINFTW